jgi:hypothetical protein
MERIHADGSPFDDERRWEISESLPSAYDLGEYFEYLIYGKRAYHRVFALIVTKKDYDFYENTSPRSKWRKDGCVKESGSWTVAAPG